MIRILHMIGSLNYGGSQILILSLLKNMKENNIVFDLIVDRKNELQLKEEFEKLGSKIYYLPRFKGYNLLSYFYKWNSFFKNHKEYKIIHGHVRSTASLYLAIAKKNGLYTIIHSHGTTSGNGAKAIVKNYLQFFIKYIADFFISCSDDAGKWLFSGKIIKSPNYKLLTNGIDFDKYHYNNEDRIKIRKEMKLEDSFVIGHVGRFTWEKNHIFLIKIFKEIKRKNDKAVLLLIGNNEGSVFEELKKLIYNYHLEDDIIFYGPSNEINRLLNVMDCFIFPSIHEGLGISIVEAQANGLKCYVSSIIPKDVEISHNINFIDLDKSEKEWSKMVLNSNNKREKDVYDKKYDIKSSTEWLANFYIKINKSRE